MEQVSNEIAEDNNVLEQLNNSSNKNFKLQDKLALNFLRVISILVVTTLILMIYSLYEMSDMAIKEFGLGFITSYWWNPLDDEYGALPFIYGTLVTSFVAIIIATPLSIMTAILLTFTVKGTFSNLLGLLVEMIAAIPSIVFGLWGLFYLAPWVKDFLSPILKSTLGFTPFFQGPSFGIGSLTAGLILAIMIIPTITSLTREVFKTIPKVQQEAALALGATRFEMLKIAVLRPSLPGIIGAVVLGLGRALGETMAVAMVIGNSPNISKSLFAPAATMASVMANEYAEADSDMHLSALCLIALILFAITFLVNLFARTIIWKKTGRKS